MEHRIVKRKPKLNYWKISTAVLAVLLIISLFVGGGSTCTGSVTASAASEKALAVVNNNLLEPGTTATVDSTTEENGLYKMVLNIGGRPIDTYISPDGSLLFTNPIDLNNPPQPPSGNPAADAPVEVSEDDDPVKGDEDAPVTIIEFSDFECPFCGRYYRDTYSKINEDYIETGKVRYVFRDFPLSFHQKAQKASEAAQCANDQGLFWEMHDTLFENQGALDVDSLKEHAEDLGLDMDEFEDCLDSGKYEQEVKDDLADGQSYGVSGTPAFFINGRLLVGAQPYAAFEAIIEEELAK